jgi:hypothetical protein
LLEATLAEVNDKKVDDKAKEAFRAEYKKQKQAEEQPKKSSSEQRDQPKP